jgi:hypothetical protein
LKTILTTVAAAALLASLSTGATSAAADGITLKRSGSTTSRTNRQPAADEAGDESNAGADANDTGNDDATPSDTGSDTSEGGWTWGGGNNDEPAAGNDEPSTRTLVVRSDRRSRRRHARRHCVESYWNACGERQRTLWIFN